MYMEYEETLIKKDVIATVKKENVPDKYGVCKYAFSVYSSTGDKLVSFNYKTIISRDEHYNEFVNILKNGCD